MIVHTTMSAASSWPSSSFWRTITLPTSAALYVRICCSLNSVFQSYLFGVSKSFSEVLNWLADFVGLCLLADDSTTYAELYDNRWSKSATYRRSQAPEALWSGQNYHNKNITEYDDYCPLQHSWVTRLRNKFKKYRSRSTELTSSADIERMRQKYGRKRKAVGTAVPSDNPSDEPQPVVRIQRVLVRICNSHLSLF